MRCPESKGKKSHAMKTPLCDIESSSLFLSLPLFISVSCHLRAPGQCESGNQRDHCSLSLALGKYSRATKRWLHLFLKDSAWEWVVPNSRWWCPLRGEVPICVGFLKFFCNKCSFLILYNAFSLLLNLKKDFTHYSWKSHLAKTTCVDQGVVLFPFQRRVQMQLG